MVMSLLGHYNNFFFAAHLLDIAMGVKTLRTILSSVTHNGKQVWRAGTCVEIWERQRERCDQEIMGTGEVVLRAMGTRK